MDSGLCSCWRVLVGGVLMGPALAGDVLVVLCVSNMDQLFQLFQLQSSTDLKTIQVFLKVFDDLLKYSLKYKLQ